MTVQRILIKLVTAGVLPGVAQRLLRKRTWRIESGEAAGLRLAFPQNLDYILGSSEIPMQQFIARHLSAGGVFYDIGANVGFFSLLAGKRVGPEGFVCSFEPLPENVRAIRRNALLNGMTNVSVFEVAVDAESGTGELFLTEWDGGSFLSSTGVAPQEPLQRRTVRVVALDDFIEAEGLRPPTLVKIDVEGVEMGVLRGMLRTLETFKPVLVYEVDDGDKAAFERRWRALDHFAAGIGYEVTHLDDSYPNLDWHVGHSVAMPGHIPSRSGESRNGEYV
jgi:FkbM family methyltransferase